MNKNILLKFKFSIAILIALFIGITFFSFIKTGFTTYDDTSFQLLTLKSKGDLLSIAISYAKSQARFFFIYSGFLLHIPYLVNNYLFTRLFGLGSIIVNSLLFYFVIKKLTGSKTLSQISFISFIALIQNSWEHNLLNAYAFTFTTSVSLLLISLYFFDKYISSNKIKYQILSAILFFVSLLTYETFLTYFFLFFLISIIRIVPRKTDLRQKFLLFLKYIFMHFIAIISYLLIYYIFSIFFKSSYDGNKIGDFSLKLFFKTIFIFGKSSLPLYYFFNNGYRQFIANFSYTFEGGSRNPIYILLHAQPIWIVRNIIGSSLFFLIFASEKKFISIKSIVLLFTSSVCLIFFPHTIIAMTTKYQQWVSSGATVGFTTTYFSYFGSILLFSSGIYLFVRLGKNNVVLKTFIIILASICFFFVSLFTDYSNYHISLSQSQSNLKWEAINYFIKTDSFKKIPQNSYLYAPNLWNYMNSESYWTDYISVVANKKIVVIKNAQLLETYLVKEKYNYSKFFYFRFVQENKDPNYFVVFCNFYNAVNFGDSYSLSCDQIKLFTHSKYRKFNLHIQKEGEDNNNIYIDGKAGLLKESINNISINKDFFGDSFMQTNIKVKKIDPDSLFISYFDLMNTNYDENVYSTWKDGCYELEKSETLNWHWCTSKGTLYIINKTKKNKNLLLKMEIRTGYDDESSFTIESKDSKEILKINYTPTTYTKYIQIPPGAYKMLFSSDAKRYTPEDLRDLRFAILNFSLDEIE